MRCARHFPTAWQNRRSAWTCNTLVCFSVPTCCSPLCFTQSVSFEPSAQVRLGGSIPPGNEALRGTIAQKRLNLGPICIEFAFSWPLRLAQFLPPCFPGSKRFFGALGNQIPFNFSGYRKGHRDNLAFGNLAQKSLSRIPCQLCCLYSLEQQQKQLLRPSHSLAFPAPFVAAPHSSFFHCEHRTKTILSGIRCGKSFFRRILTSKSTDTGPSRNFDSGFLPACPRSG